MNKFIFDASALVKRFVAEKGSPLDNHLFHRAPLDRISCLMLSAAEGIASLIRKRNGGVLSATSFAAAVTHFRKDVLDAADFVKLSADNTLIMAAILLLDRHPINSADSIVLQATLDMATIERSGGNDVILVASDQRLLRAAQAEGIVTFDPETQTQTNLDALIGP